jgi:hypothetical protein
VARAGDRLHRSDWYHSYLHRTTWTYSFELMQQKPRGRPQGTHFRLVPGVKRGADNGDAGLALGIRLARRHIRTSMNC